MKKERYLHIDFLKAVAVVALMIIHIFSYYLDDRLTFTLWNWLHFVVPIFVFASGYLLVSVYKKYFFDRKSYLLWIRKRVMRLLLPYYFFLFLHYFLWWIFPHFFQGLGLSKDLKFIFSSIFLFGGVDFNWFVLLFVQLTILSPLIVFSLKNKKRFSIVFLTSVLFSLYFFFFRFPYQYFKRVMVIPWLMVFYLGIGSFLVERKLKKTNIKRFYVFALIIFSFIFLFFYYYRPKIVFTENKYPPNLAYLSYGLAMTYFLLFIATLNLIRNKIFKKTISFLGENSYNLFLVHYIFIDFVFSINKNFHLSLTISQKTISIILLSIAFLIFFNQLIKLQKRIIFYYVTVIVIIFLSIFFLNRFNKEKKIIAKGAILEWIQKPAAIRFVDRYDRSYISWISHSGKIQMRYYDHQKQEFSSIVTVDDLFPEHKKEAKDDHNAPSLLILPSGHLLIFYTVHDVKNAFFVRKSLYPEDIHYWSQRINLAEDKKEDYYTYPQPKLLPDGRIIVFYRKGVYYHSKEYYRVSDDEGKSWGEPIELINFGKIGVYAFIYQNQNTLHLAWNLGKEGYPPKFNLYYALSQDGGVNWNSIDGQKLSLPINDRNKTLVLETLDKPAYIWDVIADKEDDPLIFYTYDNDPNHQLRIIRWEKERWRDKLITYSKLLYNGDHFFSGGGVFDPKNSDRVIVSKQRDKLELEEWLFDRKKNQWFKNQSITNNSFFDNFRPQFILNYHPSLPLIWCSGQYQGLVDGDWSGYEYVNLRY